MTTILPITPKTPSSLLAALALSPVLAPLNSNLRAPSQTSIPSISLLPPSPIPPSPAPSSILPSPPTSAPIVATPIPTTIPILTSPPKSQPTALATHRVLGLNEARQITLLMVQHLYPVRASSKGIMKASIDLAGRLHESGIRWDQYRRVMGMHLRGIWEEGSRLVGGIDKIATLDAEGQGVVDLYVQGSFLSVAEEAHPLDPTPLPILTAQMPDSVCVLPSIEPLVFDPPVPPPSPWYASELEEADHESIPSPLITPAKEHTIWRKRMNQALKIHIDRKRMMTAHASQPFSAVSAMSMMSVTELKWTLVRRMRYKLQRAVRRAPRSAKRMHFGGWEMR